MMKALKEDLLLYCVIKIKMEIISNKLNHTLEKKLTQKQKVLVLVQLIKRAIINIFLLPKILQNYPKIKIILK